MPILENKTGQGLFIGPETTQHIRVCLHLDELPFSPRQSAKSKHSWAAQSSKPGLSLSENVPWHGTQQCWGTPMAKPSHSHIRPSIQEQWTSRNTLDTTWNETGKAHPSWGGPWGPTDRICHHSWAQHHRFNGEESLAASPTSDRLVSVLEAENLVHRD